MKGEGRGSFPQIPPTRSETPLWASPGAGREVGLPSPARPPRPLCRSSGSSKAATVVWLRRGEDSLGAHDAGLGRPGVPGLCSPGPKPSLCGKREGTRATGAPAACLSDCSPPSTQVHFSSVTSLPNLVEDQAFGERRAFLLGEGGGCKKQKTKAKLEGHRVRLFLI